MSKPKKPPVMDDIEFCQTLNFLGLTYPEAAKHLGLSLRAVSGYGCGGMRIPDAVAHLLRLWFQIKNSPRKVRLPF